METLEIVIALALMIGVPYIAYYYTVKKEWDGQRKFRNK
jgi:hypothetical protein